jgi:hypothetical protein
VCLWCRLSSSLFHRFSSVPDLSFILLESFEIYWAIYVNYNLELSVFISILSTCFRWSNESNHKTIRDRRSKVETPLFYCRYWRWRANYLHYLKNVTDDVTPLKRTEHDVTRHWGLCWRTEKHWETNVPRRTNHTRQSSEVDYLNPHTDIN